MSSNNDTMGKTLLVTILLCVVCSVVVSAAAVILKPQQVANKELDRKSNILAAAGIADAGKSVDELFEQITTKYVDIETGKFVDVAAGYDETKAAKDPQQSLKLDRAEDRAGIKTIAKVKPVYLVQGADGNIEKVVLPVHGKGLWSTLYGFLALEGDLNTVVGLGFYSHAETPGLGGEVDNPAWKALWPGKKVYGEDTTAPKIGLIKGSVDASTPDAEYKVDGLSGATLTANGVTNLVQFWMGENGYAPFLNNLRAGEA